MNFEMAPLARRSVAREARLMATSSNTWRPADIGPRPGRGAIAATLEAATGQRACHVDKPNSFLMRLARKRIVLAADEAAIIGETMETGIRGATDPGLEIILVPGGSPARETPAGYPFARRQVGRLIDPEAARAAA